MNDDQFEREKLYQLSLFVAKAMKEKTIITAEEYSAINTILMEKYRPLLGGLQAEKTEKKLAISAF